MRRWEAERQLPVHRLPGGERSGVYAYAAELREWLRNSQNGAAEHIAPVEIDAPGASEAFLPVEQEVFPRELESVPFPSLPAYAEPETTLPVPDGMALARRRKVWFPLVAALIVVMAGAALALQAYRRGHKDPGVSAVQSASPETLDLYLQGRYFFESRSETNLLRAVDLFTQAIVHDPQYAPAYAGLADSYLLLREYGHMSEAEAFSRANAAAERATALGPDLPEGHRALGFVLRYYKWDMASADREFQRAIALNPSDSQAHHWYATSLYASGRAQESLREIDLARSLQPQAISVLADRGLILGLFSTDASQRALEEVEASAPDFPSTQTYLSQLALRCRRYAEFIDHGLRNAHLIGNQPLETAFLRAKKTLAANGAPAMLKQLGAELEPLARQRIITASTAADVFAAAGNAEATLRCLQLAYDRHESSFVSIGVNPLYNFLNDSAEFNGLANKRDVALTHIP